MFQNDSCVMYLLDITFESNLSFCLKKKLYFLWKNTFFLACNKNFTCIFTLIVHWLSPNSKQCPEMLVFPCFKDNRALPHIFSTNRNIGKKNKSRNIENLIQGQHIAVRYSNSDPNYFTMSSIVCQCIFISIEIRKKAKKKRLKACKNKMPHAYQ